MKDLFDVIKKPCLTEKGMTLQENNNQVVIKVNPSANKIEIKNAVEKLFNVKVDRVRTANMHGKKKRVGLRSGRCPDWKKAIVTLAEGHKIDFLEEI
ncbi:MAG: 50S ribosomal protein L23 [Deltaproteobacteria bacterium]|jgi:large subunit ribosomal protein L23|nr:50S ribosomal protein L23 [Deltaproteobacteria bacterium]NOR10106.1 50S ribosomal protein L23 [Desulfovibrionaceae bacterium]